MTKRFIQITNKRVKVYDAETTLKEMSFEFAINFFYAFVANIMTPFIVSKWDFGIFVSYLMYAYMLSYILNRDKYESKLGRYIMMPVPYTLGAFTAIKLGYLITNLIL